MACLNLKKSNCKNCYKCIRHCPVKAIRFSGNQAHIMKDACILCGQCFVVCPQNAKEIVSVLVSTRFSDLWSEPDTRLDAVSTVDGLLKPVVEETNLSDGTEDALFCFLWTKIRTIFLRVYVENGYCFVVPRGEDAIVVYPYLSKDKLAFSVKGDTISLSKDESSYEELLKILV